MSMVCTAFSEKDSVNEVVEEITSQVNIENPKMVLYFSSTKVDLEKLGKRMNEKFSTAEVFGCTTSGEIVSGKMMDGAVVAMVFAEKTISDVKLEIVKNEDSIESLESSLSNFEEYYSEDLQDMNYEEYLGMVLFDGLSGLEEKMMDKIGLSTNVVFVGGSAGDDLKFEQTSVFANGEVYSNASVLALLKPAVPFDIVKTQSFNKLNKKLVVTEANPDKREVVQFNNKPAVNAYAEALNSQPNNIDNYFMKNPVGLIGPEGEPFVRSPQRTENDKICFYCNVLEGMELSLLESGNIVEDTRKVFAKRNFELKSGIENILAVINFNCILRTLQLKENNKTKEYAEIFSPYPTIGFSTYGESFLGHINQTATMVIFGEKNN